jgi:trk system potassium uptake protein
MKFCVIGLGRFGYQVAKTLAENGMEVLGVDSNDSIITSIRDDITQAVCLRIGDEDALISLGAEEMDVVIVAMGENFAQSILITALLKKRLNVPLVITRAISEIHKEILKLIGADRVILPEQEIGIKLADTLSAPYAQLLRITKNFGIGQISAPAKFAGKKVYELNLVEKYAIHCIGLQTADEEIININDDYVVQKGDKLVCSGPISKLVQLSKLA